MAYKMAKLVKTLKNLFEIKSCLLSGHFLIWALHFWCHKMQTINGNISFASRQKSTNFFLEFWQPQNRLYITHGLY